MRLLTLIILLFIFLAGMYFYSCPQPFLEGLTNAQPRCPNLLIQKDAKFYLYNTKLAEVPGVNPIVFDNLEQYTEFLEWQRSNNIRCPVLYLQKTYDAQGSSTYKIRPSVTEPQGGLPPMGATTISASGDQRMDVPVTEYDIYDTSSPSFQYIFDKISPSGSYLYEQETLLVDAGRNDMPYNTNSYPSYDPTSYYQGSITPLDKLDMAKESSGISDNAMDPNWGGPDHTEALVAKGQYKGNEVAIRVA